MSSFGHFYGRGLCVAIVVVTSSPFNISRITQIITHIHSDECSCQCNYAYVRRENCLPRLKITFQYIAKLMIAVIKVSTL